LRLLAKIRFASRRLSRPSASIRMGHRLQRGVDMQQAFFGRVFLPDAATRASIVTRSVGASHVRRETCHSPVGCRRGREREER